MRRKELVLVLGTLLFCGMILIHSSSSRANGIRSIRPVMQPPVIRNLEPSPEEAPPFEPEEVQPIAAEPIPEFRRGAPGIPPAPPSPLLQLTDDSSTSGTSYTCYSSVDWAEVCIYRNLCHDGNKVVIFDDSKTPMSDVPR